jgi:polyphenol oxidase
MTIELEGTRRAVIGGLAALAGSSLLPAAARGQSGPVQPDDPEDCSPVPKPLVTTLYRPNTALPIRTRKSIFELGAAEVSRLQAAYAALRTLTVKLPNDARGWQRQANVHCWYCSGGLNGESSAADIHGGWTFFPWHRAYLHFQERILCKLLGDDTFALPYWDWDSSGRQVFPANYGNPNDPNPLSDTLRSATANAGISQSCVSAGIMNTAMNAPTNDLFMGEPNNPNANTAGAMENGPHGAVHLWTGQTSLQNDYGVSDMGVLATAAMDPVFFAHHANIDRLWSVWLGLASSHKNFTDPNWLNTSWQFYDENQVWTQISVAQVLDMQGSLQSAYQPPQPKPIWTFRAPVKARPTAALAAAAVAAPLNFLAAGEPPVTLTARPVTRTVAVPTAHRNLFQLKAQNRLDRLFVLRLHGISVPSNQQALFHVFVNLPSADARTSTNSPNFVGTVAIVAKAKSLRGHRHKTIDAAFDVSELLGRAAARGQLSVTLVPVGGTGAPAKTGGPAPVRPTIAQITLEQR